MVQLLWQTGPLGRETFPQAWRGRHAEGMMGRMSNGVYGAKKEKVYDDPITDRISRFRKETSASPGLRAHMSRSGRGVATIRETLCPRGPTRPRTPERQNTLGRDRVSAWTLARTEQESNNTLNAEVWRRVDGENATPPPPVVTTDGARALYQRPPGADANDQKILPRNATGHVRKVGVNRIWK
jgi:hypothetical protein